jgi:Zn-dependent protease with chaperone function
MLALQPLNRDATKFAARAFHSDLGDEPVEGAVVLTQFTFRFEYEAATIEIPYRELTIDESDDEQLIFRRTGAPDWTIVTEDYEILRHPVMKSNSDMRRQIQSLFGGRAVRKAVVTTVVCLAVAVLLGYTISLALSALVMAAVNRVPPDVEKRFGDEHFAEATNLLRLEDNPEMIEKLNALYARLRQGLPDTNRAIQFHIVDEPFPNAFSLPGHIMVTAELFELLDDPDEMAGVLGHELGHMTRKHLFRGLITQMGPATILHAGLANSSSAAAEIISDSQFVLGRSFSRAYEREADAEGWRCLVAAHIDPRGLSRSLEKMRAWESSHQISFHQASTHPPTDERIHDLNARWEKPKDRSGFDDLSTLWPRGTADKSPR